MPTPCHVTLIYGPDVANAALTPDTHAIIPLTGSYKLTTANEYGEDGISPVIKKHTLEMEAIIYDGIDTGTGDNMEAECERLRNILLAKGQQLDISTIGLGAISTINLTVGDVKGGPLPRKVFVDPFASNNAILIRWTVDFFLPASECGSLLPFMIDYSVAQEMNVDDEGNMAFTVNGIYKAPSPIVDPEATLADLAEILDRNGTNSFQGMTKEKKTSISRDGRTLEVNLTYREVKSDNAYFPFTSNIDVNDSIDSSLINTNPMQGAGFYTWVRSLSGVVRLPARAHKAYAWVVILKILRARFRKMYPFTRLAAALDIDDPNDVDQSNNFRYLPLRINITNPLYKREIKFSVKYMLVCDLPNLLNSTKIFARVNTGFTGAEEDSEPTQLSDQWEAWQKGKSKTLTGKFQYDLNGFPVVFNQCVGVSNDHQLRSGATLPFEDDPDWDQGESGSGNGSDGGGSEEPGYTGDDLIDKGTCSAGAQTGPDDQADDAAYPEAKFGDLTNRYGEDTAQWESWVKYENEFEMEENPNIVPVSYLEEPATNYYQGGDRVYASPQEVGMTINGRIVPGAQTNPQTTISRGHSRWMVRMKGYAIRVNNKIPIPFMTSIADRVVERKEQKISHKQISPGDIPVYLAMWDILYIVTGGDIYRDDVIASIESTGAPAVYQ